MIVLGIDTATSATAVALAGAGAPLEMRDDPPPGAHPGHATRLLPMAAELLSGAGIGWGEIERLGAGTGPGTFTGLRVGIATAQGLAASLGVPAVGVPSARALADGALAALRGAGIAPAPGAPLLAVIDARRGEVFAAAYADDGGGLRELAPARALAPADLAQMLVGLPGSGAGAVAVGDGAERYAQELRDAGLIVPELPAAHPIRALAVCELAASAQLPPESEVLLPSYGRRPDAELALAGGAA